MSEEERRMRAADRGASVSVEAVEALIGRVQQLVDSPAEHPDALAWHVEAAYLGDLPALASLAALAARRAEEHV